MSDFILKGPYEVDIKVHVTNDDGTDGVVTIGASMAEPPDEENIKRALTEAEKTVSAQGFRLMNKKEFFNKMMQERLGAEGPWACPGGNEWDE
jgi:hypothetical protein